MAVSLCKCMCLERVLSTFERGLSVPTLFAFVNGSRSGLTRCVSVIKHTKEHAICQGFQGGISKVLNSAFNPHAQKGGDPS